MTDAPDAPDSGEQPNEQPEESSEPNIGAGLAIGMSLGVAVGIATDNLALWIGIGMVFGLSFAQLIRTKK